MGVKVDTGAGVTVDAGVGVRVEAGVKVGAGVTVDGRRRLSYRSRLRHAAIEREDLPGRFLDQRIEALAQLTGLPRAIFDQPDLLVTGVIDLRDERPHLVA